MFAPIAIIVSQKSTTNRMNIKILYLKNIFSCQKILIHNQCVSARDVEKIKKTSAPMMNVLVDSHGMSWLMSIRNRKSEKNAGKDLSVDIICYQKSKPPLMDLKTFECPKCWRRWWKKNRCLENKKDCDFAADRPVRTSFNGSFFHPILDSSLPKGNLKLPKNISAEASQKQYDGL